MRWSKSLLLRLLSRVGSLTGWQFPPTFLNSGATDQTFQQCGKQDSFRHIWESLASILKISDSQLFRPTTGIQPGPDALGKLRSLEAQP